MQNYTIKLDDGRYFGGWDFEGNIYILPDNRAELKHRMQYPLAIKTIEKVEKTTGHKCSVERIA